MSKQIDVDSYIADTDAEAQFIMNELRKIIKSTVPQAEEKISYNVPFYKYYGEFVGFASYKKHVSFGFGDGVLQSEDRTILEKKGYTLGKATMQIKFGQEVPTEDIKKILEKKAKMNEAEKMVK